MAQRDALPSHQTALRNLLRRHVPDADVDTHLSEVEMRNLGLYGYGVKGGG